MKRKRILSFLIAAICLLNYNTAYAMDYLTVANNDTSIPIVKEVIPQIAGGNSTKFSTKSSGGVWKYSISWGNAEANSYTDSTYNTRWPIDRICATYMNITSNGELMQSVSDEQFNSSHAAISPKSVYVFAVKKGRYIFEHSGFETLDTTLTY